MDVRSWDRRHQSSAFSKFIMHVRMSIPVCECFLQVLGQSNDRGQIAVQGTVTVISIFAVTMWCAWRNCRGARDMNIQYLAQALCLINKYLMILSTTRAVFGLRPVAGRRKTKAWASFFCFDECSGNSKLDLQVFGVRSWDDLVDFFRSASHVLGSIEMTCLTILTLLFGLLHVSQI